jgi:hypothetical protein
MRQSPRQAVPKPEMLAHAASAAVSRQRVMNVDRPAVVAISACVSLGRCRRIVNPVGRRRRIVNRG